MKVVFTSHLFHKGRQSAARLHNHLVICSEAVQQVAVIEEKATTCRPAAYPSRDFCIRHRLQVSCAECVTVV